MYVRYNQMNKKLFIMPFILLFSMLFVNAYSVLNAIENNSNLNTYNILSNSNAITINTLNTSQAIASNSNGQQIIVAQGTSGSNQINKFH